MSTHGTFLTCIVTGALLMPMLGDGAAPDLQTLGKQAPVANVLIVNPACAEANDANPGTAALPLRTISRAAELVQPGTVVRIHSGVYRERVAIKQSGTPAQPICFEAAAGAQVVVTGADLLTGWTKDELGNYSVAWPHHLFQGDKHNPGGAEQVFIAGKLLRKVANRDALNEGTFCVDLDHQKLLLRVGRNPDEDRVHRPVEGSVRTRSWSVTGAYVHTRGLCFRYAANRAQQGMAQFLGSNAVVEACTFEWSNSTGALFCGSDIQVLDCLFQDNGQQGFSATRADRLHMDGCTVQRNNVKNYPRGWEAGGDKICLSRGTVLENCRFLKNHGNGVWFDISNVDCTVRNCLIADNEDAGIFYEISYGLHAHDNVIVGNGLAKTKGAWGANGGVCVSSSPGCLIERNLIIGNEQGFCFREQDRTTPRSDGTTGPEVPVWNHDEVVRNNLIAGNRTAQVQGWFDIDTERHWPKALQAGQTARGRAKADVAAGYRARQDGVPPGLTLADLKLSLQGNLYALAPGEPFFIWGANWQRKQSFTNLVELGQALGFEDTHSRILPPLPVDEAKRDFRLPLDHPAITAGVYPVGKIPDCEMTAGVQPRKE